MHKTTRSTHEIQTLLSNSNILIYRKRRKRNKTTDNENDTVKSPL